MSQTPSSLTSKRFSSWTILAVLLLILLVGAFLRFYRLDSLPPGLFMDEAMNGIDAQEVWRNGRFPIFFEANNGREPLYIYLQAAALALLGENVFSLRLVSAYTGLLTVSLAYALGKSLFQQTLPAAAWLGVMAAAALAVSFWHVSLSRLGFRTILLPFFAMLTVFWFWRGWQKKQIRWFVFAGLALGVSQYTYLAARLLPIVFVILAGGVMMVGALRHRLAGRDERMFLAGIFWMAVTMLLITLPLGVYLWAHPVYVSARTADVSIWGQASNIESAVGALAGSAMQVTRMFVDRGDMILRHNLPGRPALDWLNVIGFVTGLALLLRHWRWRQGWLLLVWLIALLLPTLLAVPAPHYLRASGAVGAVAILSALGLVWWWEHLAGWLEKQTGNKPAFRFWALLPLLFLAFSGVATAYDYFERWANVPQLYDAFETLERQAAAVARRELHQGSVYLIPDLPAQRSPALTFLLKNTDVRFLPSGCLVYQPQAAKPVTYLVRTQRDHGSLPQLQTLLPGGVVETAVFHPVSGEIFFETYTLYPDEQEAAAAKTAVAQFGDVIQLLQAEVQRADNELQVTMTWQRPDNQPLQTNQSGVDHTLFFHLYRQGEENGSPVAQLDGQPCYPTGKWRSGEALRETYSLTLPPDLPPGEYTLALGWYTWPTFERLPLTAGDNRLSDQRYRLGQITIGN